MKEHIILSVPSGSRILHSNGSVETLNKVPDNALELLEAGATHLMFKESAKEPLKKLGKERLMSLISVLRAQKRTRDLAIVELALAEKEANKNSKPETP